MSDETKCCGNCRWRSAESISVTFAGREMYDCKYPLPITASDNEMIYAEDGNDCQCFSPPIPQEVIEAVKEYKDWREQYPAECGYLRTGKLPGVIADYAITLPQLKGNQ